MKAASAELDFYRRAAFRPGVHWDVRAEGATFSYRELSFEIEYSECSVPHVTALCDDLKAGVSPGVLTERLGPFWPFGRTLVDALDRYGLLCDLASPEAVRASHGEAVWRTVKAFTERARARLDSPFAIALADGDAKRPQLIAYVEQYFHIVSQGSRIAAAAFANARPGPSGDILERFLQGEIGHESMLVASLAAVGVDASALRQTNPWAETFAITTALQVLADQEPLSLAACLFLVEEANPDFHDGFRACCQAQGMPDGFWQPILDHAGVNDDSDHGSISQELLSCFDVVTEEEEVMLLRQTFGMLENLQAFDRALDRVGK